MESDLCWVTISEHWASLGVWLMYPVWLHWRKLIFPLPVAVFVINFLARTEDLCPLPLFCTLFFFWFRWTFCKPFTWCHSLLSSYVHLPCYAQKMLFPYNCPPPLMVFTPPLLHRSLHLEGRRTVIKAFHSGLNIPTFLAFMLSSCGFLC